MKIKTDQYIDSANNKMLIAEGLLQSIRCTYVVREIYPKGEYYVDTRKPCELSTPYLMAVVFELIIKFVWEISNKSVFSGTQINEWKHDIFKVFNNIDIHHRDIIQKKYDSYNEFFANEIRSETSSNKHEWLTKDVKSEIIKRDVQSLKDALKYNALIVRDNKYGFQYTDSKHSMIMNIICSEKHEGIIIMKSDTHLLNELVKYYRNTHIPMPR